MENTNRVLLTRGPAHSSAQLVNFLSVLDLGRLIDILGHSDALANEFFAYGMAWAKAAVIGAIIKRYPTVECVFSRVQERDLDIGLRFADQSYGRFTILSTALVSQLPIEYKRRVVLSVSAFMYHNGHQTSPTVLTRSETFRTGSITATFSDRQV